MNLIDGRLTLAGRDLARLSMRQGANVAYAIIVGDADDTERARIDKEMLRLGGMLESPRLRAAREQEAWGTMPEAVEGLRAMMRGASG